MLWSWHWWLFVVAVVPCTIVVQFTCGARNTANVAKYGPRTDYRAEPGAAIAGSVVAGAVYAAIITAIAGFHLASYCQDMSEISTTTPLARIRGVSRSPAEAMVQGTEPLAIRMVKEAIDSAYSRPATASLDAMRPEALTPCGLNFEISVWLKRFSSNSRATAREGAEYQTAGDAHAI